MADLGRAALVVSLGLALYALVAGTFAALTQPAAARGLGAERAARLLRLDARRLGRARVGARPARLPFAYVAAHTSRDAADARTR